MRVKKIEKTLQSKNVEIVVKFYSKYLLNIKWQLHVIIQLKMIVYLDKIIISVSFFDILL